MYNDMACLNRWRINWYNFEPLAFNVPRDDTYDVQFNDIHCPECVPKCNEIEYSVQISASNFDAYETTIRFNDLKCMYIF